MTIPVGFGYRWSSCKSYSQSLGHALQNAPLPTAFPQNLEVEAISLYVHYTAFH